MPIGADVFTHPAIKGAQEATFKLQLDRSCSDPHGLFYVVQATQRYISELLPDQGPHWDYGRPDYRSIEQFDWAPHLEHSEINHAMLAFTIPSYKDGAAATVASLLRHAHSWFESREPPAWRFQDSQGRQYRMHLSCLEMARWVTVEAQSRATRHNAERRGARGC